MRDRANVLLVEDNQGDADLIRLKLMEGQTNVNIVVVSRLSEALENLGQNSPALVLLDLGLPDSRGEATLRCVLKKALGVPVVILSGQDDEELAVKAVHQGAQDYLVKGSFDGKRLARSMRYAIERQQMLTSLDLSRKQQLQLKDQFLSHVSHELRAPLNSIYQFVTILLDGLAGPVPDEQREHLETSLRSVNQLRTMIGDLLEATRAESGKTRIDKRCFALQEVMHQTVAMMQATAIDKEITLEVAIDSSVPLVYADPERVIQVLINLIQNAIKFTPRHGSAIIRACLIDADPEFVHISVADTGVGVKPEARFQIFERLYQEPGSCADVRNGLGLGLYIAKQLVQLHGGRIWLGTKDGPGSIFHFTLPLFSLTKLLAPVITTGNRLRSAISLITVEVTPIIGADLGSASEIRDVCVELFRLCILPNRDLLLPALATTKSTESLLIVASTDLKGAHVVMERMRSQLESRPGLLAAAKFTFTATSIPLPVEQDGELVMLVQRVADTITQVVTGALRRKVIFDSLNVLANKE
jgi:sigma-B regulation protein RsbU (phosphoserine phosphatase)